ncbi:MAG TPA: class II aldolase/adducin family protein [Trebonia sp.]|nr:class II aldolase/adducin family protein [Trebonia sp.]
MPEPATLAPEKLIALACRVLAYRGLAEDILGHVSLRDGDGLYVRSRGPDERGLLFTGPGDVHRTGLDDDAALPGGYAVPNELPIHREVLRARPDVQAVVHVHPPAVVAADLAGLTLAPVVGAYNIPAMRMAHEGIPVYPRGVLINRPDLGRAVAAALGGRPACILRGHGIVTCGATVAQAVVRALNVTALAQVMLLASTGGGGAPAPLPDEDIAELPDLGPAFFDETVWRSHVARLEHEGLGL